jgi:hypothetical protein
MRVTLFRQSVQKRRGEAEPGEISQLLVFLCAGARAGKSSAAATEF